jgi:hypothetical protein
MSSKTRTSTVEIRRLHPFFMRSLAQHRLPRLASRGAAIFLYKTLRKHQTRQETHKKRTCPRLDGISDQVGNAGIPQIVNKRKDRQLEVLPIFTVKATDFQTLFRNCLETAA